MRGWKDRLQNELVGIYLQWVDMAIMLHDYEALTSVNRDMWSAVIEHFLSPEQAWQVEQQIIGRRMELG